MLGRRASGSLLVIAQPFGDARQWCGSSTESSRGAPSSLAPIGIRIRSVPNMLIPTPATGVAAQHVPAIDDARVTRNMHGSGIGSAASLTIPCPDHARSRTRIGAVWPQRDRRCHLPTVRPGGGDAGSPMTAADRPRLRHQHPPRCCQHGLSTGWGRPGGPQGGPANTGRWRRRAGGGGRAADPAFDQGRRNAVVSLSSTSPKGPR